MKSRAWVGIVVIGILGLTLLGFLTKFAIESNTDLQDIIRFKTAFARDFSDRGIEEVSLRRRHAGGRYSLVLTGSRDDLGSNIPTLDREVAAYFVENFPDEAARVLDISYVAEGAFGCRDDSFSRRQEVALGPLRRDLALREVRDRLSRALLEQSGSKLVTDRRDNRVLTVEVEAAPGASNSEADLRSLALEIEPIIRQHLRVHPYVRLRLRVVGDSRGGPPAVTSSGKSATPGSAPPTQKSVEVQFDARGRPIIR